MARTRALDYETKRRSILDHAAKLFARNGYAGTSIAMIGKAGGMSKALLYHYYPDKAALLFDLLSAHLKELLAVTEKALDETADPAERLVAISAALLEAYRDADATHQVQISSLKLLPQERQEQLREIERQLVNRFSEAIAAALPEVGAGALLKPVTMSLFGMLNWHYLWFREGRGLSRRAYAEMAAQMVLSGAEAAIAAAQKAGTP